MRVSGRVIERDGRHYLIFGESGVTRAIPVRQNAAGEWEPDLDGLGGVWGEHRPNAQGGTDCIIHVPCLTLSGELGTLGKEE